MAVSVVGRRPVAVKHIVHVVRSLQRRLPLVPRQVTVVFTSPLEVRRLNRRYRDHDRPTTILAFNLATDVGELYVSLARIRAEARAEKVDPLTLLLRLIIHGTLHLAGFGHDTARQRGQMTRLERRFTSQLLSSHFSHAARQR